MGIGASQSMYIVEDVPGKGKGLVATRDIPKGTKIIAEKPIVTVEQSVASIQQLEDHIHQQVSSLKKDQVQGFMSMTDAFPHSNSEKTPFGICRTNALPMPERDAVGIFPQACRINHACDPNAQNYWNDYSGQLTIHAIKDIQRGEEVTICYLQSFSNRRTRQAELQRGFDFTCSCSLCSLSLQERKKSDSKLDKICVMDGIIDSASPTDLVSCAERLLRLVDRQVQLWKHPAPNNIGLARAYRDAIRIAAANSDAARVRIFADRLEPLYLTAMGDDGPDRIWCIMLLSDPTIHDDWGLSTNWRTTLMDVPVLDEGKFEDWLWRR